MTFVEFEPPKLTPDSLEGLKERLVNAGSEVIEEVGLLIGRHLPLNVGEDVTEIAEKLSKELAQPEITEEIIKGYYIYVNELAELLGANVMRAFYNTTEKIAAKRPQS
jgi:hypothetical protein